MLDGELASNVNPPPSAVELERRERWDREASFFDGIAAGRADLPLALHPLTLQRYSRPRNQAWLSPDFCMSVLGDLKGKWLLDVGCGEGVNAVLFARLGARVTAIDISSGALEIARRRAEANGVAGEIRFVCGPLETAELETDSFDVVWGQGVLHHLVPELDAVMATLARCAKPDGILLFAEPVSLSQLLRRIRGWIPVVTEHTPDERPLEPAELEVVRQYLPDMEQRLFGLFGRLERFILVQSNYERSPLPRRVIANGLRLADYALLSLPFARSLGSLCVMWGHPRKTQALRGEGEAPESSGVAGRRTRPEAAP
jgi:2-polyprenyl-3-methyl-5-hydroxy-6-metoxy-1,4-benzoquinol methylase